MSSSSLLDIARLREMNSDLFETGRVTASKKVKEEDLFKRKLKRLMKLLVQYETDGKDTNQKDIQAMIHLLREVIPHMQKQERAHLEKVYKHLGTEGK
ncbi:MAG: hypothetical protein ACK4NC_00535 [Candidatus Gracilibacteria bacterium]